ncbi:polyprenyl synthetase family protein [Faecalibacillus intestinalis]|uniref:polyprenyl synthetase family protein n=1 Tax=Faecalibacillus intestinalis TaxID=1982626 RepID=UPI000E510866|nr:polyprenyl synthetase family protein [Coprobacillus sp. AF36-10BH]
MNNVINEINQRLENILSQYPDSKVKEAMYYSLKAGGKRIRPLIVLQVIRAYGHDYRKYIDIACALEMIHTYSLIHDDLPGMDNDDLRRGKPTCHKQFGEATAILAGDGLLNEAVNIILQTDLNDSLKLSIVSCLYTSSGINGMILGQEYDIENEEKKLSKETLDKIHHYKTGKLLSCAFQMGALIASPNDLEILKQIGYKIGLAFQIQDDILDVTSDTKTLGKNTGSDEANHKETYVTLLGIENSQKEVDLLFNEAQQLVYSLTLNHGLILEIIEKLWKRVR